MIKKGAYLDYVAMDCCYLLGIYVCLFFCSCVSKSINYNWNEHTHINFASSYCTLHMRDRERSSASDRNHVEIKFYRLHYQIIIDRIPEADSE